MTSPPFRGTEAGNFAAASERDARGARLSLAAAKFTVAGGGDYTLSLRILENRSNTKSFFL